MIVLNYLFCFFVLSTMLTYSSSKFVLLFVLYVYQIMDIYKTQNNYQNRYLVVMDGDVFVFKYEKCNFDKPFLSFKPKHFFW